MKTREEIERRIKDLESDAREFRIDAQAFSRYAKERDAEVSQLKKELESMDEQPPPDMDGHCAYFETKGCNHYIRSAFWSCGPTQTKEQVLELWKKVMSNPRPMNICVTMPDPDKPRIVEEDGERFAVFPVKIPIKENYTEVYVVSARAHVKVTSGDPWYVNMKPENAEDMVLKVK